MSNGSHIEAVPVPGPGPARPRAPGGPPENELSVLLLTPNLFRLILTPPQTILLNRITQVLNT